MSNSKLKNNWDKLQKLCQPRKSTQQKRSVSRDCKSIPNLQSSRQLQRRASQQDLVFKVVESSIQDIETMNSKQQLDLIFNGLHGLLGYELIMKKGKLEELLKKLRLFLYGDTTELANFGKKLGDYIINPKFCKQFINFQIILFQVHQKNNLPKIYQSYHYKSSNYKLVKENNRSGIIKHQKRQQVGQMKRKNKETSELQLEIVGLKQAINLLEQQNQQISNKIKNELMISQYEDLRRYSKSLSDKNDDLYYQNLSLLEKLQSVYKAVDNCQSELLNHHTFQKEMIEETIISIKETVEDIINLDIKKPQQFIDVDFKERMLNLTPRPNFELLISKYNTKCIKHIRQLQSTSEITQYLIQQLYQFT